MIPAFLHPVQRFLEAGKNESPLEEALNTPKRSALAGAVLFCVFPNSLLIKACAFALFSRSLSLWGSSFQQKTEKKDELILKAKNWVRLLENTAELPEQIRQAIEDVEKLIQENNAPEIQAGRDALAALQAAVAAFDQTRLTHLQTATRQVRSFEEGSWSNWTKSYGISAAKLCAQFYSCVALIGAPLNALGLFYIKKG
ncbi:MAG TPA: hypothetical protein VLE89_05650 [Chlamydiales bacterium]|nr:hypothetical protein [Chlamydiales bacterium]